MIRVAVMQPYFYPYMGYYRLMAAVDVFVIFDCVQFPRRGRVHRAPLPSMDAPVWLTLPLAHQPRETLIRDICFGAEAEARWRAALDGLDWLALAPEGMAAALPALPDLMTPYLETHLRLASDRLGIGTKIIRSSELAIDPALRGQDRVIAIARHLGASAYWNLPGGRVLYQPEAFEKAGMTLNFMPQYKGPHMSMLHAFCTVDPDSLRADLRQA